MPNFERNVEEEAKKPQVHGYASPRDATPSNMSNKDDHVRVKITSVRSDGRGPSPIHSTKGRPDPSSSSDSYDKLRASSESIAAHTCFLCQSKSTEATFSLSCSHSFHQECLRTFVINRLQAIQLYCDLKCPECKLPDGHAIIIEDLKRLPKMAGYLDRLIELEDLLLPAECRWCCKTLQTPMMSLKYKAYKVTCQDCRRTFCSYCNAIDGHWFGGCKRLKKLIKSRSRYQ
jgi:hypothetical protein